MHPFWRIEHSGGSLRAAVVGPRTERGLHVAVLRFDPENRPATLLYGNARVLVENAYPYEVAIGERAVGVVPEPGRLWADVTSPEELVITFRDGGEER